MIPVQSRLRRPSEPFRAAEWQLACRTRVSMVCTVVEPGFDPVTQTVSVQPQVQEVMLRNSVRSNETLPILDGLPVVFPTAGGWSLTFPIAVGDECDVVFNDMAMDHWWQTGALATQPDGALFRHDIGDGKAHFGLRSRPRALADYSTTSCQLRNDDGTVFIDLSPGQIELAAAMIKLSSGSGTLQGLMTAAFGAYFTSDILPFLQSKGYSGPGVPTNAVTSTVTGE